MRIRRETMKPKRTKQEMHCTKNRDSLLRSEPSRSKEGVLAAPGRGAPGVSGLAVCMVFTTVSSARLTGKCVKSAA